ncbi:cyclic nucleotide-binding domain-containing protein [Ghiorsea bivora]|uniref:cyclic nucleotide-binding domain-containing protein n=1 Tax=Ghiorsea bivora TaxID=1485545 RepID=UPI00068D1A5E|nr:cyclic nucleotide-binding domain-containing protein [Ghiorsea bivora]
MFEHGKNIRTVTDGTILLQEGKTGDGVYIIQKGHAKVTRTSQDGSEILLAELSDGQVFGEMSLVDDLPCSANVIALGDLKVCVLSKIQFFDLLQTDIKSVQNVMEILFQRMRAMNKRVVDLENQLASITQHQDSQPDTIMLKGLTEPAKHALYDMSALVVDDSPFVIGRWSKQQSKRSWFSKESTRAHVEIHDIAPYVISRQHCQIEQHAGDVYVVDTSSRLGTWVNGEKIEQQTQKEIKLHSGNNTIHLGSLDSQFIFDVFVP